MQTHFINGQYHSNSNESAREVINPATNQTIETVSDANFDSVNLAVESAQQAQRQWAGLAASERAQKLHHLAVLIEQEQSTLATLEMQQTGKPIREALAVDLPTAFGAFSYYAAMVHSLKGMAQRLDSGLCITQPEPLGVVAAIGAWNYPLQIACWKMAPALAAGNAVVFKPSEYTPLTAIHLAELVVKAGLPQGLVNVVLGGGDTGKHLCAHPLVNKVSFTGSIHTGKNILKLASEQVIPSTLELGGKSALVIFEDADITEAVKVTLMANFYTQGEVCSNAARVFVHQSILEPFLTELKTQVEEIRVGLPDNPSTQMGALIHLQHLENVLNAVKGAIAQGANCLTGGERLLQGEFAKGNFMQPTVLYNCDDAMDIVQQEVFGPVCTVLSFNSEDEVIKRVNHTPTGLAAGVVTPNIKQALRVVNQIQAGTCWVNTYNVTPPGLPFGGAKQSGFGRENGPNTLEHYCYFKTIYLEQGELGDF